MPPCRAERVSWILVVAYPSVCHALLNPEFSKLRAVLQGSPLLVDVTSLLLPSVPRVAVLMSLPEERRPVGLRWLEASRLLSAVSNSVLDDAVRAWLAAASDSTHAATILAAAQLMQHVPLAPHADAAAILWAGLATVLWRSRPEVHAMNDQRRRLALQVLRAAARLPDLLQVVCCGAGGIEEQQAAGQQQQAGQQQARERQHDAVARLGAVLRSAFIILEQLHISLNADVAYAVQSQHGQAPVLISSPGDAAEWVGAAAAALQAVPALAAATCSFAQLSAAEQAELRRPEEVLTLLLEFVKAVNLRLSQLWPLTGPGRAGARTALWQLHTALCR